MSCGVATVATDDDGRLVRQISGPVPRHLGQTAYAAEWCAANVTAQLAVAPIDLAQDCKGVVKEWAKPLAAQLRHSSIHAGKVKTLLAHLSRLRVTMRWTLAHVDIDNLDPCDHDAIRDCRGNGSADDFAKQAVDRHPQPDAALAAVVNRDLPEVAVVLWYAAKVLGKWPALDRDELEAANKANKCVGS